MKKGILLVTKDAMCKSYLPIYGNQYWAGKTPNITELAEKGTVFQNYYTAAPSTVMSFRSMMFGKFAHETPYTDYVPMEVEESVEDFFRVSERQGYKNYLIWDKTWKRMVLRYGNMLGKNVEIHNLENLNQPVGPHCKNNEDLKNDDRLLEQTVLIVEEDVKKICEKDENIMLWIHFPHVIKGRTGYGGDIDAFDKMIGMLRKYFSDDNIFISADHGNMDGYHGKFSYGFDVYTPAIEIPLITPRIADCVVCNTLVSNVDIKRIVFERMIPEREFIYSDCAYYAQPHRKLAIINNDFAYIYNKKDKSEELYDLRNDRYERCNMIFNSFYDKDRGLNTVTKEVYFSPRWEEVDKQKEIFREKRREVWRDVSVFMKIRGEVLAAGKKIYVKIKKILEK